MRPTGIRPNFSPRLQAAGFKLTGEMFGAGVMGPAVIVRECRPARPRRPGRFCLQRPRCALRVPVPEVVEDRTPIQCRRPLYRHGQTGRREACLV